LADLTGRTITSARVVSGRYMRTAISDLSDLDGAKIDEVIVKGKLIVIHVTAGDHQFAVLSTLGMTGWWFKESEMDPKLAKYVRIRLSFADGDAAVFMDARNFGTFKVTSRAMARAKLGELGPDILTPREQWETTLADFRTRVKRFGRNQTLAEGLLDQRISSGCGNYIRADAMYWAKLSPHLPMSELTDEQTFAIWEAMHVIAVFSVRDESPLEKGESFHHLAYHQDLSPNGNLIESYLDKNDRTVWYCPAEQL
jgi:formamidopyrimidine-DNA glycosylase